MSDLRKYPAVKTTRASTGKSVGATTLDVAAIQDRLGNTLTMTNFGSKGFGVVSPGRSNERQFVFTGISGSQITGISEVTMTDPYTETSGWSRAIVAGEEVVLMTNSPAFYNEFANVNNDNTFVGKQLFTTADRPALTTDSDTSTAVDLVTYGQLSRTAIAGGVNASTTVQGLVELGTAAEVDAGTATGATGAALAVTPDKLRARRYLGYYVDAGSNDTYAVTGVSATLAAGDRILVNINTANTGAATLSVDGGSNIAIVKDKNVALETGDLVADQIIDLIYDGTNWQLLSPVAQLSAANKTLLVGGSTTDASSVHTHSLESILYSQPASTHAVLQAQLANMSTGTSGSGAVTHGMGASRLTTGSTSASDAVLYTRIVGGMSNEWVWADDFTLVLSAKFGAATNQNAFIGMYDQGSISSEMPDFSSVARHIGFFIEDGTVYASVANGSASSQESIAVTLTQYNIFKIVSDGTQALFYVNGTLLSTRSSNFPSGSNTADVVFGIENQAAETKTIDIMNNVLLSLEK